MFLKDIKIERDDIACDVDGLPIFIYDEDVIIQDVIHRLRESGLLVKMIGLRNLNHQKIYSNRIINCVEDDERVVPGTVTIEIYKSDVAIRFRCYDFDNIFEILDLKNNRI